MHRSNWARKLDDFRKPSTIATSGMRWPSQTHQGRRTCSQPFEVRRKAPDSSRKKSLSLIFDMRAGERKVRGREQRSPKRDRDRSHVPLRKTEKLKPPASVSVFADDRCRKNYEQMRLGNTRKHLPDSHPVNARARGALLLRVQIWKRS